MDLQPLLAQFGLTEFRPGQEEVILAVLEGHDCLCIMPTGGGKSLCYQLPAIARPGLTLVVSPLIALMKDQVDALTALDIPATFINSALEASEQWERLSRMASGGYQLVYIAPERMRNPGFLEAVRQTAVRLLAVDEAHCISEWGHDFRPDYARLGRFREQLGSPPTIALTATATPPVRADVVSHLRLVSPRIFISGFARPNLRFEVAQVSNSRDKHVRLLELLAEVPGPGIVYASTRKGCEEVAELIARERRCHVGCYHAGLEHEDRRLVQERFMGGELDLIVATNAFGMGVNKSNLRFVVHYNMPGSLEAYYQEAGRAGRDGLPARCLLLFSYADRYVQEFFIENAHPPRETVRTVYEFLRAQREDPIEITQQEIKDRLALTLSSEGVSASEQILEKAGAIKRLDSQHNRASVWIESDLPTLVDLLPRDAKAQRKVLQAVEKIVRDRRFERVTFPLARIEAMVEMDREAVARALRELSKLQALDYVPPFRGRAIHLLKTDCPFEDLGIDFAELERRKQAEYEKLERVVRYANTRQCRQAEFLEYFGEPSRQVCGTCDNCGGGPVAWTAPVTAANTDERVVRAVRIALSGVARAGGRFGKQVVAQMLAGSKSVKMRKFGLDRLTTFGMLRTLTLGGVGQLLDELQRQNLLQLNEVERFRPVIRLSELGARVMRSQSPLPQALMLPADLIRRLVAAGEAASAGPRVTAAEEVEESEEDRVREPPVATASAKDGMVPAAGTNPATPPTMQGPHWRPDCYWTFCLLSKGFRPTECAEIRRVDLAVTFREAVDAVEHGYAIDPLWLFSAEELEQLVAVGMSSDSPDELPPDLKGFLPEQWRAYVACEPNGAARPPELSPARPAAMS